ncbi:MAG: hypothetical protein ACTSUT_12585 [Promethearchaeota archaeon]
MSVELISKTEIFSVIFTRDSIEYEAIIQSNYTQINDWTDKEIMSIQQDGIEVELNLTNKEKQEILNHC